MNVSVEVSKKLFWIFLFCMFVTILVFAKANAITFPFPNEDDGSFFLPAWNLAVHGNLSPGVLNAPNGIFWMPHGFYVWGALFLKLFGSTIEVARSVSQTTTATAAVVLTVAMARVSGSRGFASLCGLLLVSPPIIYTANTIRMESVIFLLYALAILLHENRQYPLAFAMLACSLLVHPALLVSVFLYMPTAAWLIYKSNSNWQIGGRSQFLRWVGISIAFLVLASLVAEALLVYRHAALFREQMAFQVHRKTARNLRVILGNRRGILLCTEATFALLGFCALRWSGASREVLRSIVPALLIALGLQTYAAFGYEQPYLVYSYAIVPATLLAVAYGAVPAFMSGHSSVGGNQSLSHGHAVSPSESQLHA